MSDFDSAPRRLRDPRAIRALAHPIRIKLLEAFATEGTLTATRASELLGESPASCSFHLRQLARYGFVEPAEGGRGKERPWRAVVTGLSIDEDANDLQEALAAAELAAVLYEQWMARVRHWERVRDQYPIEWRRALEQSQWVKWLTPEEAHSLIREVVALVNSRFPERIADPTARPEGALPIEFLLRTHPFTLRTTEPQ